MAVSFTQPSKDDLFLHFGPHEPWVASCGPTTERMNISQTPLLQTSLGANHQQQTRQPVALQGFILKLTQTMHACCRKVDTFEKAQRRIKKSLGVLTLQDNDPSASSPFISQVHPQEYVVFCTCAQ